MAPAMFTGTDGVNSVITGKVGDKTLNTFYEKTVGTTS